jgi:hypothetical protein
MHRCGNSLRVNQHVKERLKELRTLLLTSYFAAIISENAKKVKHFHINLD